MNRKTFSVAAGLLLGSATLLGGAAQASTYVVNGELSSLSDVHHFGGALIPEILDYVPHGGELDPAVIANWPLMHVTQGTWDPAEPEIPPVRGGHDVRISGVLTITDGEVTAAELNQLDELRYGTFQSYNFVEDFGTVTDLVVNGLIWNLDTDTDTLVHQAGEDLAICEPAAGGNFGGATGTALSGQCNSSLRTAVNNSAANSLWNWLGVPGESYIIKDVQNAPYHSGTGLTLDIGGHQAVTWDLSGFEAGVGGTVRAQVTNSLFNSDTNNATGVAATFTLEVVLVQANDDAFTVDADSLNNALDVLANDVGLTAPVSVVITVEPDQGGTATFDEADGTISYTPALNFVGEERFSYQVTGSGAGEVGEAEVTVTVETPRRRGGSSSLDPWFVGLLAGLLAFGGRRRL